LEDRHWHDAGEKRHDPEEVVLTGVGEKHVDEIGQDDHGDKPGGDLVVDLRSQVAAEVAP
jgi:hypothetical protein